MRVLAVLGTLAVILVPVGAFVLPSPAPGVVTTVMQEDWSSCTSDPSTLYAGTSAGGTIGIDTYVASTSLLTCPSWTASGQAWLTNVTSNSNSGAPLPGSKAMYLNEGPAPGQMTRTLTGLTPGGYYEISVLAWKDAGNLYTTLEVQVASGATTNYTMPFASNVAPQSVTLQFPVQNSSATITLTGGTQSSSSPIVGSVTVRSLTTVAFDANGGTGTMATQSAGAATALTANAFTRTGCTFASWNTSAGGSGTSYTNQAQYPFSASATLYAQWTCAAPPAPAPPAPAPPAPAPPAPPAPGPSQVVVPTPSPTIGNLDPIPHQVNANIPPAGVPLGNSMLLVNGAPTSVTVVSNAPQQPTGLDVSGPGFTMRLYGTGDDSDPLGLGQRSQLILQSPRVPLPQRPRQASTGRSGKFAACIVRQPMAVSSGTGFKPGSSVRMYVLPGTLVGSLQVDASGAYSGSLPVPVGLGIGDQTLQVNGYSTSGAVRSLSLGVQVIPTRAIVTRTTKASVFFDPMSSEITPVAKEQLNRLARKARAFGVRTVAIGFVQQTPTTNNDRSLSTMRARSVVDYLRTRGVSGAYVVRGKGVAGPGASARRVNVQIAYQSGCGAIRRT